MTCGVTFEACFFLVVERDFSHDHKRICGILLTKAVFYSDQLAISIKIA